MGGMVMKNSVKKEIARLSFSIVFTLMFLVFSTMIWYDRCHMGKSGNFMMKKSEPVMMELLNQDILQMNDEYKETLVLKITNPNAHSQGYQLNFKKEEEKGEVALLSHEKKESYPIYYRVFDDNSENSEYLTLLEDGMLSIRNLDGYETIELTVEIKVDSYSKVLKENPPLKGVISLLAWDNVQPV